MQRGTGSRGPSLFGSVGCVTLGEVVRLSQTPRAPHLENRQCRPCKVFKRCSGPGAVCLMSVSIFPSPACIPRRKVLARRRPDWLLRTSTPKSSKGLSPSYRGLWGASLGPRVQGALALTLEPRRKDRLEWAPSRSTGLSILSCSPPPSPPCGEPHPFHVSQSLQTTSSIMFSLINF